MTSSRNLGHTFTATILSVPWQAWWLGIFLSGVWLIDFRLPVFSRGHGLALSEDLPARGVVDKNSWFFRRIYFSVNFLEGWD